MYLSRLPILFYNLVNVNLFFTNNLCFHIGTYIRVWDDKTTIEEEIIGWICENYRNINEYTVDMTQRKRYYTCYGPSIKYFNGFVAIGYAMCVKEHILLGSKTVVRATKRVRGFWRMWITRGFTYTQQYIYLLFGFSSGVNLSLCVWGYTRKCVCMSRYLFYIKLLCFIAFLSTSYRVYKYHHFTQNIWMRWK